MDRVNRSKLHVENMKYELKERYVFKYRDALRSVSLCAALKHYVIVQTKLGLFLLRKLFVGLTKDKLEVSYNQYYIT